MNFEKVTDSIVLNMLRTNRYVDGNFNEVQKGVRVWANKSTNPQINKLLSVASKNLKGNQGYPEYVIHDEKHDAVIVIEDKRDIRFHKHHEVKEKIEEYAVNGALWYAENLKEQFDVIAIAVSGNSADNLLIDTYAWKKKAESFNNVNEHKIFPIEFYNDLLNKDKRTLSSDTELRELNQYAKDINEFLRNYMGVMEHKRLYVLGSILFSLEDPAFKMAYSAFSNNKDLSEFLYQSIERKVKASGLKRHDIVIKELKPALEGLANEKEGVKEQYPNGTLVELVNKVDNLLFDYYKNSQLDLISVFFNVFLSYSTSGGSDLGIVLTPPHVTKLFCDLADINAESKILDPCVGTGGFLTSAWKSILLSSNYTSLEKELFRRNNLVGVEKESSIYTIVALNMFLNKDGKSNLLSADSFSIREELKAYECNVGFINPPYSDEVYSEIEFVELMLDSLMPNSIGVAIVPVNSVSSRTKKHSGLDTIKRRIMQKHKLLASIQMPNQLFYPKGTETIILVFEAYKIHEGETWFALFDDGYELIKHQKMRTPKPNANDNYMKLVEAFRTKKATDFSFTKEVTYENQWVYTLHKEVNYTLTDEDIQESVNDYLSYLIKNRYFNGERR